MNTRLDGCHFFLLGFIHLGSLNLRSLSEPLVDAVLVLLLDGSRDSEECLDASAGLLGTSGLVAAIESKAGGV